MANSKIASDTMQNDTTSLSTPIASNAGTIVARIESIFEYILNRLARSEELSIEFKSRRNLGRVDAERQRSDLRFPGRDGQEAQKFGRIMKDASTPGYHF
jgi:hypothetical protein